MVTAVGTTAVVEVIDDNEKRASKNKLTRPFFV